MEIQEVGPGSYEKNILNQDIFSKFNQYKKPKNIIETIKMSVIPTEIQKFIEKYQSVAFNSRGKRFNYKNEELEKEKPGPGAYSPDINYSQNKQGEASFFERTYLEWRMADRASRSWLLLVP